MKANISLEIDKDCCYRSRCNYKRYGFNCRMDGIYKKGDDNEGD